jgi:hypothetical protein
METTPGQRPGLQEMLAARSFGGAIFKRTE